MDTTAHPTTEMTGSLERMMRQAAQTESALDVLAAALSEAQMQGGPNGTPLVEGPAGVAIEDAIRMLDSMKERAATMIEMLESAGLRMPFDVAFWTERTR